MNENETACAEFITQILQRKSWIDICCEEEEREEAEAELALKKEMEALDQERKQLFLAGEYELEEGEIFE